MQVSQGELEEIVERILREKPEILISVLRKNKDILREVGSEILPANVATKDDIKMLHDELKLIIEMFNRRFEDMQKYMDRRFEDMQRNTDKRFEDLIGYTDKRFEDMNRRLDFIQRLILFLLGLNLINTSTLIIILLKIFNVIG